MVRSPEAQAPILTPSCPKPMGSNITMQDFTGTYETIQVAMGVNQALHSPGIIHPKKGHEKNPSLQKKTLLSHFNRII